MPQSGKEADNIIPDTAEETGFLNLLLNHQRTLFNDFIIKDKVDFSDHLVFRQRRFQRGAVQLKSGFQIFEFAFRDSDLNVFFRAQRHF